MRLVPFLLVLAGLVRADIEVASGTGRVSLLWNSDGSGYIDSTGGVWAARSATPQYRVVFPAEGLDVLLPSFPFPDWPTFLECDLGGGWTYSGSNISGNYDASVSDGSALYHFFVPAASATYPIPSTFDDEPVQYPVIQRSAGGGFDLVDTWITLSSLRSGSNHIAQASLYLNPTNLASSWRIVVDPATSNLLFQRFTGTYWSTNSTMFK